MLNTLVHSFSNQHLNAVFPEKKIVKIGSDPPIAKQNPMGRSSGEKKAPGGVPCKNCLIAPRRPLQPGQTGNTKHRPSLLTDAPCVSFVKFRSNSCAIGVTHPTTPQLPLWPQRHYPPLLFLWQKGKGIFFS